MTAAAGRVMSRMIGGDRDIARTIAGGPIRKQKRAIRATTKVIPVRVRIIRRNWSIFRCCHSQYVTVAEHSSLEDGRLRERWKLEKGREREERKSRGEWNKQPGATTTTVSLLPPPLCLRKLLLPVSSSGKKHHKTPRNRNQRQRDAQWPVTNLTVNRCCNWEKAVVAVSAGSLDRIHRTKLTYVLSHRADEIFSRIEREKEGVVTAVSLEWSSFENVNNH